MRIQWELNRYNNRETIFEEYPSIRKQLVIVWGLKEDEDEKDLVKQVKSVIEDLGYGNKYEKVFMFTASCNVGANQFKSKAAKIWFLKRTSKVKTAWNNRDDMWFKINGTLQKRKAR